MILPQIVLGTMVILPQVSQVQESQMILPQSSNYMSLEALTPTSKSHASHELVHTMGLLAPTHAQ